MSAKKKVRINYFHQQRQVAEQEIINFLELTSLQNNQNVTIMIIIRKGLSTNW